MADRREAEHCVDETGARKDSPALTAEEFKATPEFKRFKRDMKALLRVSKDNLDQRIQHAKRKSPRAGSLRAPGRKPNESKAEPH